MLAQSARSADGDVDARPAVVRRISRAQGVARSAAFVAGFGSMLEPATGSGSWQQPAGAIH